MAGEKQILTLAHSPDSDDAFMFWALAKGHVKSDGLDFQHILRDIQSLNQAAIERIYDITAISVHAYPYVSQDYAFMNVGASVGDGYGPIVVAREPMTLDDLSDKTIGIPGALTTANLVLRLAAPGIRTNEMAFDIILDSVKSRDVDAGLIIHEGQLTYESMELHKVVDLGEWWRNETGLPLPLGANVIRRDLGDQTINIVASLMRKSISYAMKNRVEAISYAGGYGRDLSGDDVDKFVGMYVNDFTLDWGDNGRKAVVELLTRGADAGIVPAIENIEFTG
jgi:1,4-dihydroxy-6-naphthoate synthase